MRCTTDRAGHPRAPARGVAIVAAALASSSAGCAFDDGRPWGTLRATATAAFAPPPGRAAEDGALLTAEGFAVALADLRATFSSLAFSLAEGAGAPGFDPARPPPGYSLCHNGHCHAADGRLVDYADVAREIDGASADDFITTIPIAPDGVALTAAPTPLTLGACPDRCDLPRGTMNRAAVRLVRLEAAGRVADTRTGDAARLSAPTAFTAAWALDVPLAAPLSATIGPGEPIGVAATVDVKLTHRLFDGVDWAAALAGAPGDAPVDLTGDPSLAGVVGEALAEHSPITVAVKRFDP